MKSRIDVCNLMAKDAGVFRYAAESDASFCMRTAYSAVRFIVDAACLDDGFDAKVGISKQALNRRVGLWIHRIGSLFPDAETWFCVEKDGISTVYNRLIDVEEIRVNGFKNTYVATPPRLIPATEGTSLVLGLYDSSDARSRVCGLIKDDLVVSGLIALASTEGGCAPETELWWQHDIEYRQWEKAGGLGEVRFANPKTPRWSVGRPDVWAEHPVWTAEIGLAKREREVGGADFFVARRRRGCVFLSPIKWNQAQSLFFFMRKIEGNQAVTKFVELDERHVKMVVPIGFVPGRINRVLDAVTWPVENVKDRISRIARKEALPLIEDLLAACHIGLRSRW